MFLQSVSPFPSAPRERRRLSSLRRKHKQYPAFHNIAKLKASNCGHVRMEAAFLTWGVAWTAAGKVRHAASLLVLIPVIAFGISALDIGFRLALGVVKPGDAGSHLAIIFGWSVVGGLIVAALVRARLWRTARRARSVGNGASSAAGSTRESTVRRIR